MQHYIIVKWNEKVLDKEALIPEIEELFQQAVSIPGIHKVELIPNIVDRPNRYDLMIVVTMEQEALSVYDDSIYHKQWKEQYGERIAQKAIFDSEDNHFIAPS